MRMIYTQKHLKSTYCKQVRSVQNRGTRGRRDVSEGQHNMHTCHYLAPTHRWRSGLAVAHLSSIAPLRDVNKNGLSDTRLSLSLANRSFEVFFSSRGSMYWHPSWNPRRYTGGAMRVPPRKFFFPNQRRLFFCRSRCLALVGTSYLDVACNDILFLGG